MLKPSQILLDKISKFRGIADPRARFRRRLKVYTGLLENDGFSKEDAYSKIVEDLNDSAQQILLGGLANANLSMHAKRLPFIDLIAPDSFHIDRIAEINFGHSDRDKTRLCFRYFELWKDKMGPEKLSSMLTEMIDNKSEFINLYLGLYIDKVLPELNQYPKAASKILRTLSRNNSVGVLSRLGYVPDELKKVAEFYNSLDPDPYQTDKIVPIRRVDRITPVCSETIKNHKKSMSLSKQRYYEGIFLSVDKKPVLWMKFGTIESCIGLCNVYDSKNRLVIVTGVVYILPRSIHEEATERYQSSDDRVKQLELNSLSIRPMSHYGIKIEKRFYGINRLHQRMVQHINRFKERIGI
tara:strand:+ start:1528 stop:2589 length:1062 start_codon:yes stop_codon:yes gene_type:complete